MLCHILEIIPEIVFENANGLLSDRPAFLRRHSGIPP
jgi:hypothetical protein